MPADHNAAGLYRFGPHGDDNPLARLLAYQHCAISASAPDAERLQRVRYKGRAAVERGDIEEPIIRAPKMVLIGGYWKPAKPANSGRKKKAPPSV
jgi:hypothetical protein